MKHVWILNHYAQEPDSAGGTRHFSLGHHLRFHGWKATIIGASVNHSTGQQRVRPDDDAFVDDLYKDVHFRWLRTPAYSGNGLARVLNILCYTRAALKVENVIGLEQPDIIIGSSVHPLAAWAGCRLARRYGVPFVFEVRDLWPQTLIDMGRISYYHPAAIGLRWLEKSLYRSADRIISLLPHADDYIRAMGIHADKIVWIPNGVSLNDFPSLPAREPDGKFTFMYFGAHGSANGLQNLLEAMQIIEHEPNGENINLRLIGDGPLKQSLTAFVSKRGITNVQFEPPVTKSQIPGIAAEADAFIFNLMDVPVFKYGISSNKLFDFLAARRPIIFCCKASNNPVKEAGAGLTVSPEDPPALAAAILELKAMSAERREEMGKAGRSYLERNHSMDVLAGRLASTLDECLSHP